MNNNKKRASVIIPAFNEEKHIQNTLQALRINNDLEIIVVDNGSTDQTAEIANQPGVNVIDFPSGTIAAVRNRGVKESSSKILIFIDADVRVSPDWHEKLVAVVQKLHESPLMVTGSRVQSAVKNNWLHKYWFTELTSYSAPYINSGHLITTRLLFDKIHGFSEILETAEDYDFCQKAIRAGAVINNNTDLVVMHDGYPDSLVGFIQRERWHGRQDVENWSLFLDSKIAWFATLNLILLLIAVLATLSGVYLAFPIYLILMYVVSFLLTVYKFGLKKMNYMLIMPVIFYCYLYGRTLALVDRLSGLSQR
ncbi:MAG: glycosyltransferase [Gammaproteobacteria bacterium]|nr:glycosyltransferase [Gammaproteobacteria bacterium]